VDRLVSAEVSAGAVRGDRGPFGGFVRSDRAPVIHDGSAGRMGRSARRGATAEHPLAGFVFQPYWASKWSSLNFVDRSVRNASLNPARPTKDENATSGCRPRAISSFICCERFGGMVGAEFRERVHEGISGLLGRSSSGFSWTVFAGQISIQVQEASRDGQIASPSFASFTQ